MRPEVQVLPGPRFRPVRRSLEVTVKKPVVLLVGAVAAAVAVLKRRQRHADAALWREATSDTSR
jgi:hypothetical protein